MSTIQQIALDKKTSDIQAQKIIRTCYIDGQSTHKIATNLNMNGYKTQRGRDWTSSNVSMTAIRIGCPRRKNKHLDVPTMDQPQLAYETVSNKSKDIRRSITVKISKSELFTDDESEYLLELLWRAKK